MLTGFLQTGAIKNDRKLFDEIPDRNVSSWNSIITGYCGSGLMREARYLFDRIGGLKNLVSSMVVISWNAHQALDYTKGACSHVTKWNYQLNQPTSTLFCISCCCITCWVLQLVKVCFLRSFYIILFRQLLLDSEWWVPSWLMVNMFNQHIRLEVVVI